MDDTMLVWIWSNEHGAFWAPNSRGYVTSPSKAGLYPLKEARQICEDAGIDSDVPNETIAFPDFSFGRGKDS